MTLKMPSAKISSMASGKQIVVYHHSTLTVLPSSTKRVAAFQWKKQVIIFQMFGILPFNQLYPISLGKHDGIFVNLWNLSLPRPIFKFTISVNVNRNSGLILLSNIPLLGPPFSFSLVDLMQRITYYGTDMYIT